MEQKNATIKVALLTALGVLLLCLAGYFLWQSRSAAAEKYQAVFLTNGQVYFGKISGRFGRLFNLRDIYYLQMKQDLQGQDRGDVLGQSDLSLIKLGKELHGPEDRMNINWEQVLFIEDLSAGSKVLKAIREYQQ